MTTKSERIKNNATFGAAAPAPRAKVKEKRTSTAQDKPTSIWLSIELKAKLQAAARAKGVSSSSIACDAISSYIDAMEMTKDEKTMYNAALRQAK